jgi:RNA polymerase subunit RPABC4/transcription elongation factor Spt4
MLIRCVACNKLIYSDDALEDGICPACGSADTETIAMSIVFDQAAAKAVAPVKSPGPDDLTIASGRKPRF